MPADLLEAIGWDARTLLLLQKESRFICERRVRDGRYDGRPHLCRPYTAPFRR
jgi:hypothetical protein